MLTPISIARSGFIASGNVGWPHHASGSVRSGHISTVGVPDGTKFLRDDFNWAVAGGGLTSGAVQSGYIASGAVQGFFGATRHIASGTLGVFDLGSGAVVAGTVGSGAIVSGNVASGQIGSFHIASGGVLSGNIASGQIGPFHLGSGSVLSGHIASGQVGNFHISSGAVTSGRLGTTNVPDGTKFLRDDFAWTAVSVSLASGDVGSGKIASGAVQGFFGTTRHIASGTIGVFDFGSGAVIATTVGSGAIVSGNVASGQLSTYHFASGATSWGASRVSPYTSGVENCLTDELISGIRAVCLTKSGYVRIAKASVSGLMPAIGIVVENVGLGTTTTVYTDGHQGFHLNPNYSGMVDFSGYAGEPVYVGRSGQLVTLSGSWNSGGFLSGDIYQQIGVIESFNQDIILRVLNPLQEGFVYSGNIGSGQIGSFHIGSGMLTGFELGSGSIVSGRIASGQIGSFHIASGGVLSGNIASGQIGINHLASGSVTSGAIASGQIGPFHLGSGSVLSGHIASGQVGNFHISSGAVTSGRLGVTGTPDGTKVLRDDFTWVAPSTPTINSGDIGSGKIASGAVQGFFGVTRHIASGTIGVFDFGSGAVIAGTIGSGAVVSGNIASGQIGPFHLASGSVGSGTTASGNTQGFFGSVRNIASGTIGVFDFGSGAVVAGAVGSGAIVSGNVASGQLGENHLSSGAVITMARVVTPLHSGTPIFTITDDMVSGVRAVSLSLSGNIRIAMASIPETMPAVGVVTEDTLSGRKANVYTIGVFQFSSGMADYSGYLGDTLYVGRSGQIVTLSGSWNSGGFLSGDIYQALGVPRNSGAALIEMGDALEEGFVYSGNIGSGQIGRFHIASGMLAGFELGSGAIVSGRIASGQVGNFHISSGAVTSGRLGVGGTPNGTLFLRDDFTWQAAGGGLTSGAVQSGHIASGAVQGFFGATRHIASGTVGSFDFGSGAVVAGSVGSGAIVSGNIASGQIGTFHVASGQFTGFELGSGAIVSGRIASGQIGSFHIGSGQLTGFELGSGAIVSGRVASGQIGNFHISSGAVTSGRLGVTGTPDGTKVLRDDFTWAAPGTPTINSGDIGSGKIASGTIQGFFGVTRHIASGTVGVFDFGSGAVVVGSVGSGAINSGNIASGHIGPYHLASGITSQLVGPYVSGSVWTALTLEPISGVRAVALNLSGIIQIAMAGNTTRLPAVGVVIDNVESGIQATVFTDDSLQFTSGMADYSGYLGQPLYLGRSGQIVTISGSWNSGGLLSGDVTQVLGVVKNSGAATFEIAAGPQFVIGQVYSGDIGSGAVYGRGAGGQWVIASGSVGSLDMASGAIIEYARGFRETYLAGEPISGVVAVTLGSGGRYVVLASRQSGARMPALGVNVTNALSGGPIDFIAEGFVPAPNSGSMASGSYGPVWVGSGGLLVNNSGYMAGASSGPGVGTFSGSLIQQIGYAVSGGVYVSIDLTVTLATVSGTYLRCLSGQFPVSGRRWGVGL